MLGEKEGGAVVEWMGVEMGVPQWVGDIGGGTNAAPMIHAVGATCPGSLWAGEAG